MKTKQLAAHVCTVDYGTHFACIISIDNDEIVRADGLSHESAVVAMQAILWESPNLARSLGTLPRWFHKVAA